MKHILIALALALAASNANAQSIEHTGFLKDGGDITNVTRPSNYRNQVVVTTAAAAQTITVPAGVAVSSITGAGRVDFWADNAKFAVCPYTATDNHCGMTLPTGAVSDGTAWIWAPTSLAMFGISNTSIVGFVVSSPVTNTIISADFYKGK